MERVEPVAIGVLATEVPGGSEVELIWLRQCVAVPRLPMHPESWRLGILRLLCLLDFQLQGLDVVGFSRFL